MPILGVMPRRRALVGLVAGLLLVAACQPIHPDNRPLQIPNVSNGSLPGQLLRDMGGGCHLYHEAAESFRQMFAHARRDGINLFASSCYRDYAGQVRAREDACARGECHMAAVPGTSNHGWGKAMDLRDQFGGLTFTSPGYQWLKANAWLYGWNHPGVMEPGGPVPEPWHWEWVGDGGRMFPRTYWGVGNASPFPGDDPQGRLDVGAVVGGERIAVSGWTVDPNSGASIDIHIHVNGVPRTAARANHPRPDIATAFPPWGSSPHGFYAEIPLQPGDSWVCVWGINVGAGNHGVVGCSNL